MTTALQNVPEQLDIQPEMAFRKAGSRNLHVVSEAASLKISDFFSHYVVSHPLDLVTHVQRIHFAISRATEIDVYSTLLDLFIALGSRGQSLRQTMLEQASTKLGADHKAFLSDALEVGVNARDVIDDPGVSMLSAGYSGCDDMVVVQREHRGSDHEDPLQQAMDSIECSNLDEARVILEEAFYADRSNLDQQRLLLEIYRKTDDKKHFSVLFETFEGDSNPAHADWSEMAEQFGLSR